MKKNLRNILVLSLGLMTTSVFAQDWNVDSRTRINMNGDNGQMLTEQRATLGVTWGGSDWGIHVSSDVDYAFGNWDLSSGSDLNAEVYEAYASVNLMGYATMTAGRQALDYGSGAIISSNQWGSDRNTWDGLKFDLDVDVADITIGYASANTGMVMDTSVDIVDMDGNFLGHPIGANLSGVDVAMGGNMMYANLNKADGDWTANLLFVRGGTEFAGDETSSYDAMGLDVTYAMMDGKLNLGASYNTASETLNDYIDNGDGTFSDETTDYDFMSISAAYNVSDNLTAHAGQTTYGENGYSSAYAGDMNGSWETVGGLGFLEGNDQNRTFGISYSMDKFTIGASMHNITDETDEVLAVADDVTTVDIDETVAGVTARDDRSVTEFSLGYAMSDNANLSLKYASDEMGEGDADKFMWLTLTVNP